MTSKEQLAYYKQQCEEQANYIIELQLQLEQLEDSSKIRMQQVDKYSTTLTEKYLDLKQENEKLKKALDEACKMLSWDCPCGQDLIDDLDCENRCQPDIDYSECWMKYFIKEVLGDA